MEDITVEPLKDRGEMYVNPLASREITKDGAVTIGPVATVYRPGDFVDMTLNGHDKVVEGWFRVEGPGINDTLRCGLERPCRAQFMVQGYGTYKVTFTDGKTDLASATLDIERDDVGMERNIDGERVYVAPKE
jgi:hypothetical protein